MSGLSETGTATESPAAGRHVALRVLTTIAFGIGLYLTFTSLSQSGLPVGCGAGSGCDEVLRSRWSSLMRVPVGAAACAAYAAVLVGSLIAARARTRWIVELSWTVLMALATAIVIAAIWFVGLQVLVIKALCPWCLGEHALGVIIAGLLFWMRHEVARRDPSSASELDQGTRPALLRGLIAGGVLSAVAIGLQVIDAIGQFAVARLPAGQNADSGPGPRRQVTVLDGRAVLTVHELPTLGSPDAPQLIVLLFDYCCPHCRSTHRYLTAGLKKYPDQFGVVLLPMPLDAECNPAMDETEPRFEESCELARLALAVWRGAPQRFPEFDAWLFEPEQPRTLAEARVFAGELAGDALHAAEHDVWIEERITADVRIFTDSQVMTIPLLMSAGMDTVVGRPQSAAEIFGILERDLGLRSAEPGVNN